METSTVAYSIKNVTVNISTHSLRLSFFKILRFLLCRWNRQDRIFVFADVFTCLPTEKPRGIAFIPSVLKRVQRGRVSWKIISGDARMQTCYYNLVLIRIWKINLTSMFFFRMDNKWILWFFLVQTLILALMCIAHGLESAGPTVRMTLGVSAMTNAPHMKTQCALRTEQLTTTDAGIS